MNASLTSSMLIFCAQRHSPNPAVPRAVQALNKQSSNETKMAASAGAHQAVLLQQLRQDFSTLSRMTTAHTFSQYTSSAPVTSGCVISRVLWGQSDFDASNWQKHIKGDLSNSSPKSKQIRIRLLKNRCRVTETKLIQ